MVKVLPVKFREAQVTQDDVIMTRLNLEQRGIAILCRIHLMPITAEEGCQRGGKTGFIIHH